MSNKQRPKRAHECKSMEPRKLKAGWVPHDMWFKIEEGDEEPVGKEIQKNEDGTRFYRQDDRILLVFNGQHKKEIISKTTVPMLIPKQLADQAVEYIEQFESDYITKLRIDTILFYALAEALQGQSSTFIGMLKHTEKQTLTNYFNQANRLTRMIKESFGNDDEMMAQLDELQVAIHEYFDMFKTAVGQGNPIDYMTHCMEFFKEESLIHSPHDQ